MGGNGSDKLIITDASNDIVELLKLDNNINQCNIEIRSNGIIIRFRALLETYGLIIPHLQQLFNTDKKLVSAYTDLTYVRNTGPSTNSSSIGSIHLNGISLDKTFNPGASPPLDKNDIRLTSCFKEPCTDANNNLSAVINID